MKKLLKIAGVLAVLSAGAAYAALPGSHRALSPSWFGLSKIAPNVYSDAPQRSAVLIALVAQSKARAAAFFAEAPAAPRIILCTQPACAAVFDLKPRGLTLGAHVVLIGPEGVNEAILSHELAHVHLHARMGLRDLVHQRIPAWFDEGLATHLSGADGFEDYTPGAAAWIRQAHSFKAWGRLHADHHWRETYGAAQALVADLETRLGRQGLLDLISDALDRGDFDAALAARLPTDWP